MSAPLSAAIFFGTLVYASPQFLIYSGAEENNQLGSPISCLLYPLIDASITLLFKDNLPDKVKIIAAVSLTFFATKEIIVHFGKKLNKLENKHLDKNIILYNEWMLPVKPLAIVTLLMFSKQIKF